MSTKAELEDEVDSLREEVSCLEHELDSAETERDIAIAFFAHLAQQHGFVSISVLEEDLEGLRQTWELFLNEKVGKKVTHKMERVE